MTYEDINLLAVFWESFLCLAAVSETGGHRFRAVKHWGLLVLASAGTTALVLLWNSVTLLSYLTPVISILCVVVFSKALSKGNLLLRAAVGLLAEFAILAISYMLLIVFCLVFHVQIYDFSGLFLAPGPLRNLYLAVDKSTDTLLFLFVARKLPQLSSLGKRNLAFLFGVEAVVFVISQYHFSAELAGDYFALQWATAISFLVLLSFAILVPVLMVAVAKGTQERAEKLLYEQLNKLMEHNYQRFHQDLQETSQRIHDFHHHLRAVLSMAEQTNDQPIQEYISSLLDISYKETALCHSGSDIIDSVINCSAAEAASQETTFQYHVSLHSVLPFDPVDLCSVLGNQIENALEACQKITSPDGRLVTVDIRQQEDFLLLKVVNPTAEHIVLAEGSIQSTKSRGHHGLGIKNIQTTAKKYNGQMRISCDGGKFISEVLLCFPTS